MRRHHQPYRPPVRLVLERPLFLAGAGLIAAGNEDYDHGDADVTELVSYIQNAPLPGEALAWFTRARTGQVAVNPFWPRGSLLLAASFFIEAADGAYSFDESGFYAFREASGGVSDPEGEDGFRSWISGVSWAFAAFDVKELTPAWEAYMRVIRKRESAFREMMSKADASAQGFFGEAGPSLAFAPNLFSRHSTDFVRKNGEIITIAMEPDPESVLHEALHDALASYRGVLADFAKENGVGGLVDVEQMKEYGYMVGSAPEDAARALEECFVRALSTVLAGGGTERLADHARYGFTATPDIGLRALGEGLTAEGLGAFIASVLAG